MLPTVADHSMDPSKSSLIFPSSFPAPSLCVFFPWMYILHTLHFAYPERKAQCAHGFDVLRLMFRAHGQPCTSRFDLPDHCAKKQRKGCSMVYLIGPCSLYVGFVIDTNVNSTMRLSDREIFVYIGHIPITMDLEFGCPNCNSNEAMLQRTQKLHFDRMAAFVSWSV